MKKFYLGMAAVVIAFTTASAAQAQTVINGTPRDGYFYGTGNGYTPANSVVDTFTTDNSEIADRWHLYQQVASPADPSGTYHFGLGAGMVGYDWSISAPNAATLAAWAATANITVTNLTTGQFASYNPFFAGNDNSVNALQNAAQNSLRLLYLPSVNFSDAFNNTFQVTVSAGGHDSTSFAQFGTGAVAAVPEPATWALLLLGFGGLGVAMRRKPATQNLRIRFA